jgi:hypothetical protein
MTMEQTLLLLKTILNQNYFQYNKQIYQPNTGIAMGSPISNTAAEIYIQHLEALYIKPWLESGLILYYNRYVDDVVMVYNANKTDEQIY